MKRAILIILDSLGVGSTDDANQYGDIGSNTLGHIAEIYPLKIPNLTNLGLVNSLTMASNKSFGLNIVDVPQGSFGYAKEISKGKDTVSGHWEITGSPMLTDWGYFDSLENSFPNSLTDKICNRGKLKGFLGNCHASGTNIIHDLGEQHINTKLPIFYTSADSVFQIAAHEKVFGLENLYKLCEIAFEEVKPYNIGRVIARPFVGDNKYNFTRTSNRKDYAIAAKSDTLLDIATKDEKHVLAIGKIGDIFAHRGCTTCQKTTDNQDGIEKTITAIQADVSHAFIMTNLVDFDALYGHRRDVVGYAKALEYLDSKLTEIIHHLRDDDLLVITADHGNDPTWHGSDHTREHIPIIIYSKHSSFIKTNIGKRETFSDIGASIAEFLGLPKAEYGSSFLSQIMEQ